MPQKPSGFERFWQELKRRKTGKVIVAYAATAFIILQLADILTPALLLPEWTTRLVTLILIIGFPIAVIFSWVFDITPEGIKKTEVTEEPEKKESVNKSSKRILSASNITIVVLLAAVAILAYREIFKKSTIEGLRAKGKLTVAVMPFRNMTNDTSLNVWQDGIQVSLITSLSNNPEELQVRQTESINSLIRGKGIINNASLTPSVAGIISQKLDADVFIIGSVNRSGLKMRLNAQIVDPKNQNLLKSFQIDGITDDIIPIIDSLSASVKNYLIISEMGKKLPEYARNNLSTSSPEALKCFIYGRNYFFKLDYPTAQNWFSQAISADSNFIQAIIMLSVAYSDDYSFKQTTKSYADEEAYNLAKKWCLKALEKIDQMPIQQKINVNRIHALLFETPNEQIKYLKELLDFDDQNPSVYFNLGNSYFDLEQYDKAIPEYEKNLQIFKKWGIKPDWIFDYATLGESYHKTGNYREEKRIYKKAEQDFPDNPVLIYDQTVLSLALKDSVASGKYTEKGLSWMKSVSMSDASIAATVASVYENAGLFTKAAEYYRQAFQLEPENLSRINDLAYFLIDRDRGINEGIQLIETALKSKPDDYQYLHTKGWGLYKQGKYKEALEILQKSWKIRREKAVYDHEAFLHLEAAKKAVAGMKNS